MKKYRCKDAESQRNQDAGSHFPKTRHITSTEALNLGAPVRGQGRVQPKGKTPNSVPTFIVRYTEQHW
jgi:hypothetical protein